MSKQRSKRNSSFFVNFPDFGSFKEKARSASTNSESERPISPSAIQIRGFLRKKLKFKWEALYFVFDKKDLKCYASFEEYSNRKECCDSIAIVNALIAKVDDGRILLVKSGNRIWRLKECKESKFQTPGVLEWFSAMTQVGNEASAKEIQKELYYGKLYPTVYFPNFSKENTETLMKEGYEILKNAEGHLKSITRRNSLMSVAISKDVIVTRNYANVRLHKIDQKEQGYSLPGLFMGIDIILDIVLSHQYKMDTEVEIEKDQQQQGNSRVCRPESCIGKETVYLQYELTAIRSKCKQLLHIDSISTEMQKTEITQLFQSCQHIIKFFDNKWGIFRANPLHSSPLLIAFAFVYISLTPIIIQIKHDHCTLIISDVHKIKHLLQEYKQLTISSRLAAVRQVDSAKAKLLTVGKLVGAIAAFPITGILRLHSDQWRFANEKIVDDLYPEGSAEGTSYEYDVQQTGVVLADYKEKLKNHYQSYFNSVLQHVSSLLELIESFNNTIQRTSL